MPVLRNIRHERFAQNVVSGLGLAAAYVAAGYKKAGASANAARLMRDDSVSSRVAELRNELSANFLQLQITERGERLLALQDRWERVRKAIAARAIGDYAAMMRTGIVCRRLRSIGSGADATVVEEYEIDTGAIESLNSVERRAAIETGQEVDRQDIQLGARANQRADLLAKAFSLEELEAMKARMIAAAGAEERGEVIDAPVAEKEESKPRASAVLEASAALERPVKPAPAAPNRPSPAPPGRPKTGAAEDAPVHAVPQAPRSWREKA